ncbi:MAG: UxaA family hydrolase [Bacillota bacterium]
MASENNIVGLLMDEKDNVATIFFETSENSQIRVLKKDGQEKSLLESKEKIPFGHKIAVEDINKSEEIVKYGEVIGKASKNIKAGEYVHVHNLDSTRGRGDIK